MNAKETYKKNYGQVKSSPSLRWTVDNDYGQEFEYQAMKSYRMATAKNHMTFKQFLDCLEAAQNGLAYATRNHWFFVIDGQELQFTKEECARFARYFSEGFHLNFAGYTKIIKAGGLYINERLFEDDGVFPLKAKRGAYMRFIIGDTKYTEASRWIGFHEFEETLAKAREHHNDAIIAEYGTNNPHVSRELRNGEVWLVAPVRNPLYMEFSK